MIEAFNSLEENGSEQFQAFLLFLHLIKLSLDHDVCEQNANGEIVGLST